MNLRNKIKRAIMGTALAIPLLCPPAMQAEGPKRVYGLSGFIGTRSEIGLASIPNFFSKNHVMGDTKQFLLHPYVGWRWKKFELGLEGVVGTLNYNAEDVVTIYRSQNILTREKTVSYNPQNVTIAGAILNARYDLFGIKKNKIFIGVGQGFSYWSKSIKENRTIVTNYKIIDVKDGNGGITYSTGPASSEEVMIMNHKKIPIITQGEIGLRHPFKYKNKNLEFLLSGRLSHTSAMLDKHDQGINTWGINVGIRW